MLRVLLAEDDSASAETLRTMLQGLSDVEVVGWAADGRSCIASAVSLLPDLVLLDIGLPDMSGVEVAEILLAGDSPPLVAFVTVSPDYAVQAFGLQAIDYVVKPPELAALRPRIADTVERARLALVQRGLSVSQLRERLASAVALLDAIPGGQPHSLRGRIAVRDPRENTIRLLATRRITHAIRSGRGVSVMSGGNPYAVQYTIERLLQRLEPDGFARANRGCIVNLAAVDHMIPRGDGSYDVVLCDGTCVEGSRGCSQALVRALPA